MRYIKEKFLFIVFSCILFSLQANGQELSVSSFKMMENDLTANTTGTMERDQNGETAALIKVVTTEQGFVFDGGMTGIVRTKQEVGEVWVYVPHGIKKMTIKHPQLGVLRDYWFPVAIEKARTYEMVLTTAKVQTFVSQSLKKQFVIFTVNPAHAEVEFNGEPLELDETGYAEISMPYGTYTYRATCPDYQTTAGSIEVKAGVRPEVNLNLVPDFGWLDVKTAPEYVGANVYINGKKEGTTPLTQKQMRSGIYRVKVEKPLYKDYETSVTIEKGKVYSLEVTEMVPNFAKVELIVDEKSEIWVDGELKGNGRWSGALGIGDHQIETKQASYVPASQVIRIDGTEARTIQLNKPTPLCSPMEITSSPSRAKVYIDGVEMGVTPMVLEEVLIGSRELVFEKEGYPRHTKYVMVNYGVTSEVHAVLSDPSDAPQRTVTAQPTQQRTTQPTQTTQPSQQRTTTPATSNTTTNSPKGVELLTNNYSRYSLYINGAYKGRFSDYKYDLGQLTPGRYNVKLDSKKYVGSKNFQVNNNTNQLYLKTKRRTNYFISNASVYGGPSFTGEWGLNGFKVGGYIKGFNVEYNRNFYYDEYDGYVYEDNMWNDIRIGYAFNLGRKWMLTPQIGYYGANINESYDSEYHYFYDDYGNQFGQSYINEDNGVYSGTSLACRVQFCMFRYFSIAMTPVVFLGWDWDFDLSFIFSIPFTKK